MSVPFHGDEFDFKQPDGTMLRVRGFGSNRFARFETIDGRPLTRDPSTGFWSELPALAPAAPGTRSVGSETVLSSPFGGGGNRWEERRDGQRRVEAARTTARSTGGPLLAPPQRSMVGAFVGLCVPVDFVDAPAGMTRQQIDDFCNLPGYSEFGNHGSVRDYFADNSGGACIYTNIVTPYFRASKPKSYYAAALQAGPRARELVNEALDGLRASGFDFSQLSLDDSGCIYAVNVFYAGENVNNWSEGLWPHQWFIQRREVVPGIDAQDYQCTDIGSSLRIGTFCHENGHMLLAYPDLYDDNPNDALQGGGVGRFCLMCAGNHADQRRNPTQISAYLKRLSGWGATTEIVGSETVTVSAATNEFAIVPRNETEYFIIEHRPKTGRDAELAGGGLAVWHVDHTGDNSRNERSPSRHYELSLEQADGLFELERFQAADDAGDLWQPTMVFSDLSVPHSRWWDGTSSGLTIDSIVDNGASMTFRAQVGIGTLVRLEERPATAIQDRTRFERTLRCTTAATLDRVELELDITHTAAT
jgi:M6 family metalloprotease-like protein